MKTPLDNGIDETYEAFGRDHDRLRQTLMASLPDGAGQRERAGRLAHTKRFIRGTIMESRMTRLAAAADAHKSPSSLRSAERGARRQPRKSADVGV